MFETALTATDATVFADLVEDSDVETLTQSITLSRNNTPTPLISSPSLTLVAQQGGTPGHTSLDSHASQLDGLRAQLAQINEKLDKQSPSDILKWAIDTFPNLWQTTSFGLTGCVIVDLLAKLNQQHDYSSKLNQKNISQKLWQFRHAGRGTSPIPILFIDTLHHFAETIQLSKDVASIYNAHLVTYTPLNSSTQAEFTSNYGNELWTSDPDAYDFLVKSEPAKRAYSELGISAVLTGRRRSQRGARSHLPIVEIDSTGLVKINPLAGWTYDETWKYVQEWDVPYNPLVDCGYKSIGDVHSTQPVNEGEGERDGRWKGLAKSECGLHKDYFEMERKFLKTVS